MVETSLSYWVILLILPLHYGLTCTPDEFKTKVLSIFFSRIGTPWIVLSS
jgi:hypothetical protein